MLMLVSSMRVVDQIAFGHDGRLYASGAWHGPDRSDNRGIDVWNLSTGRETITHLFPDRIVNGFIVDPTGRWLYASADDLTLGESGYFAVDPAGGTPNSLGLQAWNSFKVAVHPAGEWVIGYGCVGSWQKQLLVRWRQHLDRPAERVWERSLSSYGDRPGQMACDPNGSRVFTLESARGRRQLAARDPADWTLLGRASLPGRTFNQLTVAPDGSCLVIRAGPSLIVCDACDFGRKPRMVHGGGLDFTGIAFHPSGRYLAATGTGATVNYYDTETWKIATAFTWDVGRFRSVGYSGSGNTRRKTSTLKTGGLRSVAFSPDGLLAAAGSDTGKIVVWDVDI